MKDIEIIYLNDEHEQIIEGYLRVIKKLMYFATENTETGKYQDFLTILNSIYLYSNNFHATMIDKSNIEKGAVAEFLFLIPNMLFYTSIGFLTALKDGKNDLELRDILERIGLHCEDTTGELADILIDETENEKLINEIFGKMLSKN